MEEAQPSSTALGAAMFRAAHQLLDDPPKIFDDTFALRLCGCENETALRVQLDQVAAEIARRASIDFAQTALRHLRASVIVRSRYVEDELDRAIKRGVSQYVILGAGLDSFAYRRSDVAKVLRVFEVDHPATQVWKRARLQDLGIASPDNLAFVPVDFEKQSLVEGLRKSGYRTDAPAVFSWLGVVVYLTPDAIFGTLRTIASLAPGTEIIFEYPLPRELLDEEAQQVLAVVGAAAAARNEPLITFFEPARLAEQVRKLGFSEVWDFGPGEASPLYFAGRTDGLRPPANVHLMGARVGPRSSS
jgi:methyltransferase (TIGR00027 family)